MNILDQAEQQLKKIYQSNQNIGLLGIYLWGSILTPDFNENSDIDSIAIVDDSADLSYQTVINTALKGVNLENHPFKINFLYVSELNGGDIKGDLAKVIDRQLLLLDFQFWRYVTGQVFKRSDFSLPVVNASEARTILLNDIKRRYSQSKTDLKDYKYFLKAVARLCYYIQMGEMKPFSYSGLLENTNEETMAIVDILFELKSKDWDSDLFTRKQAFFWNFLDNLK